MIQSWENLVTDGRTDRQTDESDFIGRCPTNVERPKYFLSFKDIDFHKYFFSHIVFWKVDNIGI